MTPERLKAWLRLTNLAGSYKACFCDKEGNLTKDGARVLRDLGKFCHQNSSTLKVSPVSKCVDTHAMAAAEGRRDVARRIWGYLDMDPSTHRAMKEQTDD